MKKLNDVLGYNLKIYQDDSYFSFTTDSVILANFTNVRLKDKKVLDLGSGNGIVSLLFSLRFSKCIDSVEIQKKLALLSMETIKYNNLEDRIKVYNEDVKDYCKKNIGVYDLILCNPPYFEVTDKSVKNIDIYKAIARHEVKMTLEDVVSCGAKMLKNNGRVALVSRVSRFTQVLNLFKKYNIEAKYVRFVHDNINLGPSLFFIEGIKNGKSGLNIDKPFIMNNIDNTKTAEYKELIGE